MRRKVVQDFANVFCQRLLDLPDGHDVASFAHYGSGNFRANVLTGECSFNGKSIPTLRLCDTYRDWLREQSEKHRVPFEQIEAAAFEVQLHVSVERADHDMHALGHRSREQSLLSPHLPQLARCSRLTHRCATAHDAAFEYHHHSKHSKLRGYSSRRLAAGA